MARIDAIFEAVHAQGASDLHIATGAPPMVRRLGEMEPIRYQELNKELTEMLLLEIMGDAEREKFQRDRDVDFSYEIPGKFRVRCNVYEENRGLAGAFRLLPSSILTLEQLDRYGDTGRGLDDSEAGTTPPSAWMTSSRIATV